jgi:phage tail-like protein
MPILRETPYSAFNFQVEIEPGQGKSIEAGFSEVSGLNAEVTIAEYRAGNSSVNHVVKVPGIHKSGDITLKRGVIGAENLYNWLQEARAGKLAAKKDSVTIKLFGEDRGETPVVTWKLRGVLPIKWTGPSLTGKGGGDVAIEELVLAIETLEQL